jgi:predicted nucleotidyltransferase
LHRLRGPVGRRVRARRQDLIDTAARHGVVNLRVFGSMARGEDREDSDVDLLADLRTELGLLGLGRLHADLERIVDAPVEVVAAGDLKADVRERGDLPDGGFSRRSRSGYSKLAMRKGRPRTDPYPLS